MRFAHLSVETVSSSTGETYFIEISRSGDKLTCTCTCPAGTMGTHCKHRISILSGDVKIVSGGDVDKLASIPDMLKGTDVERALAEMMALESEKAEVDRLLKAAKKKLARVMDS